MRLLPGMICLLSLLSPLANAELIDDINDRGELRIALEADTAPFNFKEDGKLTGFEVELGQMLAGELDVRADFVVTDAADLLSGVESGKYDVAINHIALTPELAERFDTSAAYSQPDARLLASREQGQRPLMMAQSFQPEEKSGPAPSLVIPFQKGNPAFKASLDNALTRIREDGRLERLASKWLDQPE